MDMHLLTSCSRGPRPVELIKVYLSLAISLEPTELSDFHTSALTLHMHKMQNPFGCCQHQERSCEHGTPSAVCSAGRIAATPPALGGDAWLGRLPLTSSSM